MKWIIAAVAVSLAVVVSGSYTPGVKTDVTYADKDFLLKQKFFFEILRNIHLPLQYEEYMPYTKIYVDDKTKYVNFDQVFEFFEFFKLGYLEKGEIFTIYNKFYLKQTYLLFTFLYNSLDWDTYYKNVIWAREHVNEGMFIYAVTLSVMHRTDLKGIVLPAIYEIYPYYFFNTDVIRSASFRKMYDPKFGFYGNGKYNVVYSNYTLTYPAQAKLFYDDHYDYMSYYYEDIGLNSYYYYFMMDYPFFLGGDMFGLFKDRRGELYFYFHQQLLARYNLERFSYHMKPIMGLNWQFPLKMGYFSLLSYWNGVPFKSRDYNYVIGDYDYYKLDWIKDWEMRIRKIIDQGYFFLDDGTKIDLRKWENIDYLGNIVIGNADSMKYGYFGFLETFTRMLLSGNDFVTMKTWPSVLMNFETTLRDPMFYSMWERFMDFYYLFKSYLPYYTFDELNFKGVVIKDVVVDKLMTYFDFFDADISNAIPMTNVNKYWDFTVFGRTKRLNHKPFTYTLDVMSEYTGKGVIRAFIGPKFDRFMDLDYYKKYFVEVDQYFVDLVVGENTFVRKSRDFFWSVKDRTTYTELYKKIMTSFNGQDKFVLDMSEAHCGFPDRLVLPKGWYSGMPYQFYFIITPFYTKTQDLSFFDKSFSCGVGTGMRYLDTLPMGFPFDREINFTYWYTKNMFFKDVLIYHTDDMKYN
ncbi:hexamerin-1.1-like [Uranotaenia lowii]|uniref:hexamerin-1.1-like n=1 Tax=Uranotaenia lowii TaxID=190385 RepID=UPI00247AD49A|nr:hexamerin-1.1-like [Uranotaenia lowii]